MSDVRGLKRSEIEGACVEIARGMLRAVAPAIELLHRQASGERCITGDMQLRACAALARLGPAVMRAGESAMSSGDPGPGPGPLPGMCSPEEYAKLWKSLTGKQLTPEEAIYWSQRGGCPDGERE